MKQLAVLGLGRFGYALATKAYELGFDVYAIDEKEEIIQKIADKVTLAVRADISDMDALHSIGIQNADICVVALASNMNASLTAVINATDLGIEKVYAKARDEQHARVLEKLGVDKVYFPEREMGYRVAQNFISGNILDLFELDSDHTIVEVSILKSWIGRSLTDLDLRSKYNINIIALKRNCETEISPDPDTVIREADKLIIVADNDTIDLLQSKAIKQGN